MPLAGLCLLIDLDTSRTVNIVNMNMVFMNVHPAVAVLISL